MLIAKARLSKCLTSSQWILSIFHISHQHNCGDMLNAKNDVNGNHEQWKIIPKYSRYEISIKGTVRNRSTNRILKPYDRETMLTIGLMSDARRQNHHSLARLVLSTFQPRPSHLDGVKLCAAHKDGNRHNNDLNN